jgi:hypothetical protein
MNFNESLTYYKKGNIECGSSIIDGIDNVLFSQESVMVFPNPAYAEVFVTFPVSWKGATTITVLDLSGIILLSKNFPSAFSSPCALDLNGLAPGIYLIRAESGNNMITSKLIKK